MSEATINLTAKNRAALTYEEQEEVKQLTEKLQQTLKAEASLYQNFARVAKKKQQTLIDNEITELAEIVEQETEILDRLDKLEENRGLVIYHLQQLLFQETSSQETSSNDKKAEGEEAASERAEEETISLSFLISSFEAWNWSERAAGLADLQEQLLNVISEVERINEQNRQLLLDALKFNEFSLKAILQVEGNRGTYGSDGEKKSNHTRQNILDQRA